MSITSEILGQRRNMATCQVRIRSRGLNMTVVSFRRSHRRGPNMNCAEGNKCFFHTNVLNQGVRR